jgi:hypothetical protein
LNTPVLNVDFLPVGPARAAIVVFAEEYGGIGLAFGVRSNEGGQVAVFRNQESIDAGRAIADVLEPALATAEQMGFLFDEDMVDGVAGSRGRSDAMALWGDLMGDMDAAPSVGSSSANGDSQTAIDPPEIELDDLALEEIAEISLDLEDAMASSVSAANPGASLSQTTERLVPIQTPPEEVAAPATLPPKAPRLSRFRQADAVGAASNSGAKKTIATRAPKPSSKSEADSDSAAASELGRIPLVRVRREGSKRVPFLARLLSSF